MLLLLLLVTIFASQQISASILHLHGQTLVPSGGEGGTREKTKKLFLGNEVDNIPPAEARKRLRNLVVQKFSN